MNTDLHNDARSHTAAINAAVNQLRQTLQTNTSVPLARDVLLDLRSPTYNLGLLLEELTRSVSRTVRNSPDDARPANAAWGYQALLTAAIHAADLAAFLEIAVGDLDLNAQPYFTKESP